jgi:pimeloyl-ACP methyl ester carboxylesterase
MNRLASADGTLIAYDRSGTGPPLILVTGALCDRALMAPTAKTLSSRLAVFNYDRRGRGDSGDTTPYAIEREVEDLGAIIAEAGGSASLYGHSSGAGLALHAAAAGLSVDKLVLHDPPYVPGGEDDQRGAREYGEQLRALLSDGRRGDAVERFMTLVGMPQEAVTGMREGPGWAGLERIAPTLAYDSEVMGDVSRGGAIPVDTLRAVTVPTLVLTGGADHPWMIDVGRRMAEALPTGRHRILEGEEHSVPPEVLAPVLFEFLTG